MFTPSNKRKMNWTFFCKIHGKFSLVLLWNKVMDIWDPTKFIWNCLVHGNFERFLSLGWPSWEPFFLSIYLFFFKYADSIGAKVFMGFFRIWSPTHAMNRISPFKNSYILLIHRNSSRQATSILTLFMLLLLVGRLCVAMAIKKKRTMPWLKLFSL